MQPLFQRGSPFARLIFFIVISIALMVADQRYHHLDHVREVLSGAIAPLRYAVDLPSQAIDWAATGLTTHSRLIERVEQLERSNLRLRARQQRFETLRSENDRLRALLESSAKREDRVLVSELLSVDLGPYRQQVVINHGSRSGAYRGQPVIDANGVDRVDTTSTIWLGLTTACAQCHDHKYDPISQKEYYKFFAFFNSLDEQVMDGNQPNPDPFINAPTERQKEKLSALEKEIAAATEQLNAPLPEIDAAQKEWLAKWDQKMEEQWETLDPVSFDSGGPSNLRSLDDRSLLAQGDNPDTDVYVVVAETDLDSIGAIRLEALTHQSLPHQGAGRADNANFVLSELELEAAPLGQDDAKFKPVEWMAAKADYSQSDYEIAKAIDRDPKSGWAVDGGKKREDRVAWFLPAEPIRFQDGARLRFRLRFESDVKKHAIGRFRLAAGLDSREWRDLMPSDSGPWHVLGPFKAEDGQQAFQTDYGPEKQIDNGIDLERTYADEEADLKWETNTDFEDGKVQELTGENAANYLYRVITAPSQRKLTLSLGSDDAVKLWLNQDVVLNKNVRRGVEADQETVTVQLQPGKNHLLLKVVNYSGGYAFYYKQTDEETGGIPFSILATLSQPPNQRSAEEQKELRDYYRRKHSPEWRAKAEKLAALQEQQKRLNEQIPTTLVSKDMKDPMATHLLKRGEYDKPGAEVSPGIPAVLPPLPEFEGRPNRLTLAKWLVNPNHPLTARVTVNRYWQQYFGHGLVKTSEDFGTQGDSPTHPQLLDWLATEFIQSGWNIKHIHRLIVTSATYRQSSKVSPDLRARDPENRLLARGPRFRMDAEMIRDNALEVSGLLIPKIGGPSVKPYQPPGLWEAVSYGFSQIYEPDDGEARFRRSLYTFWKRQSAPPNLTTFDAPSRETCTVKRPRTNTPLQALVLMNDPQFVVASRAFAQRIMQEAGPDPAERVTRAFRLATARRPDPQELDILVDYYKEQLAEYEQNPEKAKKLLTEGEMDQPGEPSLPTTEWAAWTTVANLILNLDETITKS
jgi:hypothetical protein